jgi:hypothetical protein
MVGRWGVALLLLALWGALLAVPSAASDLPTDADLDVEARHPNGVVLRLTGVRFAEDRIVLALRADNGGEQDVALALHQLAADATRRLTLVDDRGTPYAYSPSTDDPRLDVPAGEGIEAEVAFLGRLGDRARTLTLTTNVDAPAGSTDDPRTIAPVLELTFPVPDRTGDGAGDGTGTSLDLVAQAGTGSTLRIEALRATSDRILLDVQVSSRGTTPTGVRLNTSVPGFNAELTDDLGTRYPIVANPDEEALLVGPSRTAVGQLAFLGPLDPEATVLTLQMNPHHKDSSHVVANSSPPWSFERIPVDAAAVGLADPWLREDGGLLAVVRGVTVGDGWVAVDLEVQNAWQQSRRWSLAAWGAPVLTDDAGGTYAFVPPDGQHLDVGWLEVGRGTLVFTGDPGGAQAFTLTLNPDTPDDDSLPSVTFEGLTP